MGLGPIRLAFDEYRRRHGMLSADEIRRIREQYDLSREAFAAVFGNEPGDPLIRAAAALNRSSAR